MSRIPRIGAAPAGASLMVAFRLEGRRVVVAGGGTIAAGRVALALEAGAEVVVVAPELGPALRQRRDDGEIAWVDRTWLPADLDGSALALSAIDDTAASVAFAEAARTRGIPVNAADRPDLCDFWFPSVHRDGPVQVAVSTNGQGPALARRLKDHVVASLPEGLAEATERFGVFRRRLRARDERPLGSSRRMDFVAQIARSWPWRRLAALDEAEMDRLVATYLGGRPPPEPDEPEPEGPGRIRLVGAGPGDPGLLTRAALDAIEQADLVVADRLVSPEILDRVRGELRVARKFPGRSADAQRELDGWVVEAALAGRDVVRLKCGDPCVFGRGGEEQQTYAASGLRSEWIPGVTSAFAAPVAAGIPVTHRGAADRVMVLTGQGEDGRQVDIPAFDPGTTYLWLMAVGRLDALRDTLVEAGFPPEWPAALVERGTRPEQRAVRASLSRLPDVVRERGLAAPAVVVIGRVVEVARADAFEGSDPFCDPFGVDTAGAAPGDLQMDLGPLQVRG